jgi:hypothetical protein
VKKCRCPRMYSCLEEEEEVGRRGGEREKLLDISAVLSYLSVSLSPCLSVCLSLSLSLCPGGFPAINVRKMQPIRVSGCPSVNPT